MKKLLAICFSLLFANVVFVWSSSAAQNAIFPDEPIAYIGHGAMFNISGEQIQTTPKFVNDSIEYYKHSVLNLLSEQQGADYRVEEEKYGSASRWSDYDNQIIQITLLDWLLNTINLDDAGALKGKRHLLEAIIKLQPDFEISPDLSDLLPPKDPPVIETRSPCDPGIWPDDYDKIGALADPFISDDLTADVYVKKDTSKELCVALPRHDGQTIRLFGVICQDNDGMACFWDNQEENNAGNLTEMPIDLDSTVNIGAEFPSGPELLGGTGGICTQCHAGENAFVIHPGTNLLPNNYDTTTLNWYVPDVHSSWPQNPGPGTLLENLDSAQECASCHNAANSRRFPILAGLTGYCNSVLGIAIGNTMPEGGQGLQDNIDLLCAGTFGLPRITLYEGDEGTQDEVCTIPLENPVGHVNFQNDGYSCENDEARSAKLFNLKAGSSYNLFNSPSGSMDKDFVVIEVKKDFSERLFDKFEESFEDEYLKVSYFYDDGHLKGKVSSFSDADLDIPTSRVELYEDNDLDGDLVCWLPVDDPLGHVNFKNDNFSCENDEARSANLLYAQEGSIYRLFDSSNGSTSDDFIVMEIKKNLISREVSSFEKEDENDPDIFEDDDIKITYCCGGNLDGKVSSFRDF